MKIALPEAVQQAFPPDLAEAIPGGQSSQHGEFRISRLVLSDGPRAGVELLVVDSGAARAAICPTRGMGLWKTHIDGVPCGWKSPVEGPVHPNHVALHEPDGIGWLDGFDELLVRCGLRSFGAPEFDLRGHLKFPLHGRIANLPARAVALELDENNGQLRVEADVHETRFLQYNLRLRARYTFTAGQPTIAVHDTVTNAGASAATMQLLYHINFGAPLLAAGSRLHVTSRQVVARDKHAAGRMEKWQEYEGPTAGFAEEVYFMAGHADAQGWSHSLLTSPSEEQGVAVRWRPDTLPYFCQWKHTAAEEDGYVTGLEPATGFPNMRTFEEDQGRLVELAPGASRDFKVTLEGLATKQKVAELKQQIASEVNREVFPSEFNAQWCMPAAVRKADE